MSKLFSPLTIRGLTLENRVWVSPMCQYSAREGIPDEWHLVHLGSLARGGAGLVFTEATAVVPQGRISLWDTGIWNTEQQHAWRRITDFVHGQGSRAGIQLGHAGRKASARRPWEGGGPLSSEDGGWVPDAPSAIAYPGLRSPQQLDTTGITRIVRAFETASARAVEAGFDVIEVHAAHGYLLNEFLSPLSNHRDDQYGGAFTNRARLPLEIVMAVRNRIPRDTPLFVRISATDWVEGGWTLQDSVALAGLLADVGVDLIDVSTGGIAPANIPVAAGYQVPFARDIRAETGIATAAVGLITEASMADEIVTSGSADAVFLGRALLRNPHWPFLAAQELGVPPSEGNHWPPQYLRARQP